MTSRIYDTNFDLNQNYIHLAARIENGRMVVSTPYLPDNILFAEGQTMVLAIVPEGGTQVHMTIDRVTAPIREPDAPSENKVRDAAMRTARHDYVTEEYQSRPVAEITRESRRSTVDQIFLRTLDPTVLLDDHLLPAATTLMYRLCDRDATKFEEATRLVGLFIQEALCDGQ